MGPIGPVGNGERNQPYQAPIGHGRNRTGTPSGTGFGPIGPGPIGQPPSFNMPRVCVTRKPFYPRNDGVMIFCLGT